MIKQAMGASKQAKSLSKQWTPCAKDAPGDADPPTFLSKPLASIDSFFNFALITFTLNKLLTNSPHETMFPHL